MDTLDSKITSIAQEVALKHGLEFVYLKWTSEEGMKVLRIALDKKGGIGLPEISAFNDEFSPLLDEIEELSFSYVLDCCSPGAEREIEVDELFTSPDKYLEQYMEITDTDGIKYLGTFIGLNDGQVQLNYFDKGRKKKALIAQEKMQSAQLRVKI